MSLSPVVLGYRRFMADLLVSPEWLVAHHADPKVRLLDPRSVEDYAKGHVPGAVSAGTPFKDPDDPLHVMPPQRAQVAIRALGISDDSTVVITHNGMLAGRAWWFLRFNGLDDVRIADGGFEAYREAGGPVTIDVPTVTAGTFKARVRPELIARADDIARELHSETRFLDVRSDKEWTGSNSFEHKRVGHIPGARHIVWDQLLESEPPHRFRSPERIRAMLADHGITPSDRVVTVCEVGWRASHSAFALRLAGFTDVRVYDASMREWDNREDLPLEPPAS